MKNLFNEKKSKVFSFFNLFIEKLKNESFLKFVFIVALIFVVIFFSILYLFSSPSDFPVDFKFQVEKGRTLKGISYDLKQMNIIRSRTVFEFFSILLGNERRIKEGYYYFDKKISVFEVARRISKGEKHLPAIKITIPEGFTVKEMADLLNTKLINFEKDKFLATALLKEGYLFPDTYFFSESDNFLEVIKYMENNYEKKINPLRLSFIKNNKDEKEIITMASIIEKEAKGKNDRAIISGILWKRLNIGMPLQVDSEIDTYKNKGFPEKPISNPGLKAIESALNPISSPYLYYLHDKNGIIHYARTYEEHKNNINSYLR
ncbi:MAG: endolytic transglycosylase MltG [Candidatus Paceibacterota bacterium]|jgi:UPF0755 protein